MENKTKRKKPLTDSQLEIIRFLGLGAHIYLDERGKWILTGLPIPNSDGKGKGADTGHATTWEGESHLYRPTVEFLAKERIIIGYFDKESNLPCYKLCSEHPDYAKEIKCATVEAVLGITRSVIKERRS